MDGLWVVQQDTNGVAGTENWDRSGLPCPRPIAVPSSLQAQTLDAEEALSVGTWWYQRSLFPPSSPGRRLAIRFRAVWHNAEWCAGTIHPSSEELPVQAELILRRGTCKGEFESIPVGVRKRPVPPHDNAGVGAASNRAPSGLKLPHVGPRAGGREPRRDAGEVVVSHISAGAQSMPPTGSAPLPPTPRAISATHQPGGAFRAAPVAPQLSEAKAGTNKGPIGGTHRSVAPTGTSETDGQ